MIVLYRFVKKHRLIRGNHVRYLTGIPTVTKLRLSLNPIQVSNTLVPDPSLDAITKDQSKLLKLPPSLRNVRIMMDKYKDNVVLTQMGSFYELYFEQALNYAPKLNISLTSRNYTFGKVPFAGFPVNQLNRHLKVLVNQYGYSVTIADQFRNEGVAENDMNRFQRRVTRTVTPGTFIDDAFENFKENSFLLNIEFPDHCMEKLPDTSTKIGLSWADISTGEIFVQQVLLKDLISTVTRIKPKEILLSENLLNHNIESGKWYPEFVEFKKYFIKYQAPCNFKGPISSFFGLFASIDDKIILNTLKFQIETFTQKEVAALRNILSYVNEHLPNVAINFQIPERQTTNSMMQIDSRTSAALELHSTVMNSSKKGSLLSSIRRTVTPIGTRLLTQWLSAPTQDLQEIRKRQRIVNHFKSYPDHSEKMISYLKCIHDLSRIIQKFSFGRGTLNELLQIAISLTNTKKIEVYLKELSTECDPVLRPTFNNLAKALIFDETLVNLVIQSINEDEVLQLENKTFNEIDVEDVSKIVSPTETKNYSTIKNNLIKVDNYPKLRKWHETLNRLYQKEEDLKSVYESLFVEDLGARKVTLKQRQNNDYALHITASVEIIKKIIQIVKEGIYKNGYQFFTLQKSHQTIWLSHQSWIDLSLEREFAFLQIKKEEKYIMDSFMTKFIEKSNEVRVINNTIGYLDTLISFSVLANEKHLVCPKVDNSRVLEVVGGRHLMVEDSLSAKSLDAFTSNDCYIQSGELNIITGPNMGGKSTYLRQNAIIVVLSQIGCFVPCIKARIGLVDKIFSRIGSADDLYNEMSTFMVEMIETSFILRGATDRSLAIMDEIGRGTSGKEGVGIAYATSRYLLEKNKCRTLFATHFGKEIQSIITEKNDQMLNKNIKFLQSSIIEAKNEKFMYDYKLKSGICSKSDALKVAKLAGFPQEALNEAQTICNNIQ